MIVIAALCCEFKHAVIGIIHALRVVHFKAVAPQLDAVRLIGADLDMPDKHEAAVIGLREKIHTGFGVIYKLFCALCGIVGGKIVDRQAVVLERKHAFCVGKAARIHRGDNRHIGVFKQIINFFFYQLIHCFSHFPLN